MIKISRVGRVIGVILAAGLLAACGGAPSPSTGAPSAPATAASEKQIAVVATTSIIADLVANVGGERVAVRTLLPPGTDPHSYAPTPGAVQAVADAQILFVNGLGLEAWLDELTANAGGERTTVVVSDGLKPMNNQDQAEGGADPHMWFDVQNAIGYVENIRKALQQVDPPGASTYTANAAAYTQQLEALDAEIKQVVASVPAERRKLVTNHDTFGYFAARYGFEIVGTVFEGVSTEQEPSAQQIAQLVERIRAENVPAVFTENTVNARLAEQIADEAGVNVVTTLYTDALGEPDSAAGTYITMMRYDTEQIVNALK